LHVEIAGGKMDRWYDEKFGIILSLQTIIGFNHLIEARSEAFRERKEKLADFVVLGHFLLDICGNCMRLKITPEMCLLEVSQVLTVEEFRTFLSKNFGHNNWRFEGTPDFLLPIHGIRCAYCGESWTIENCFDVVIVDKTIIVSLYRYLGKTLGYVMTMINQRTDALYKIQPEYIIFNDHGDINLSVKDKLCWLGKNEGVTNNYVIQPGDELRLVSYVIYHHICEKDKYLVYR
jgi:hypothetical protein